MFHHIYNRLIERLNETEKKNLYNEMETLKINKKISYSLICKKYVKNCSKIIYESLFLYEIILIVEIICHVRDSMIS